MVETSTTPLVDEQAILDFIRQNLHVAAVCDILDDLGYREQAMHQRLRPLLPDMHNCGFVGRARTLRWMETDYIVEEDPYGLEIDFMDSLKPGDVIVHSTDFSGTNAPWGELMTTVAKYRGAVDYDGIVVIPQAEVQQVLKLAQEKMTKESHTRADLLQGKTLREVYDRYGVL